MDLERAKEYVENLLDRLTLVGGRYELPGGVLSAKERSALAVLAGLSAQAGPTSDVPPPPIEAPAIISKRLALSDDCLGSARDDSGLLCVDFGTAYSKAAVWRDGDDAPIPLDLGGSSGGGLTTDSAAYISEGHIFFGPIAVRRHAEEGDVSRSLFASPKEHLTHDHARFQADRPSIEIDPTNSFRTRDLLALYLGYLTALVGERVEALGVGKHVLRLCCKHGARPRGVTQLGD